MDQDLFEWLLLLGRWIHIITAVTWIGTSIFFMWLDRSFEPNPKSTRQGHVGEAWLLHGGGFYHVEKLQMGSVKVPEHLHWFKWEAYWTWMSGMYLLSLIFYTSSGTFLLDSSVSSITFIQGILISLLSVFGSWFFYDYLWEHPHTRDNVRGGNIVTLAWLGGMTYFLCHTLSGRAAYMHIGAMIGTWMAGNVFMRIIPRQAKMVEAAKKNESVNPDWATNAKNRSTHNTYLTLPIIFIMLSNHFPMTYGHELNWLILLIFCTGAALIRHFFILRLPQPGKAIVFLIAGCALISATVIISKEGNTPSSDQVPVQEVPKTPTVETVPQAELPTAAQTQTLPTQKFGEAPTATVFSVKGIVKFEGHPPAMKKLMLPQACAKEYKGDVYSNEVIINNGNLQNVLVRITAGQENLPKGEVPTTPVVLDQHGCLYSPRVAAARVGQEVVFLNSDTLFHNVKSVTKENPPFNIAMPQKDQRVSRRFLKPEVFVEAKCSVHPWMQSYLAVLDHPYFAISKADGTFEIPGLPPGNYTVEFWHEVFGTKTENISVTDKGIDPLTIVYKGE